jgi:hypothetical protein
MLWGAITTWAEAMMNSSAYRRHAASPDSTQLPRWEITEPMVDDFEALRRLNAPAGRRP